MNQLSSLLTTMSSKQMEYLSCIIFAKNVVEIQIRKGILLLFCLMGCFTLFAQEKMYIHTSGNVTSDALISETDSVYFSSDNSTVYLKTTGSLTPYTISKIDSISFDEGSDAVYVTYNGNTATIINPFASQGVVVTATDGDVIVVSTLDKEINYILSGTTSNGMFKIYSNHKFDLILNAVSITNADGPAIDIQSGKKCTVILNAGASSSLTDGSSYASSTEDQKATFFSEGQLEFQGTGSLTVKSVSKHAICSDDYIYVQNGTITVSGAYKDGIHSKDYFKMSGGTLNITATGDGIDCEGGQILVSGGTITTINAVADAKGMTCDSTMEISGGTIAMTVSGNQSKGIKCAQKMSLNGGSITINTSGAVVLAASGSGYDPSYCTAIKGDDTIAISGTKITVTSTGAGCKGISSDKGINIISGNVNITTSGTGAKYTNSGGTADSYSASCLSSDGNITITGGSAVLSSSGAGGKGISADGTITLGDANHSPTVTITTTGSKFAVSGTDYCHPKAIVSTGAITIQNGTIVISSSDDGIHSEASITQNSGNVTIINSVEGVESKYITINGGNINVTASNDGFNATFSTVSGGTESNDGSCLYLKGGYVVASCTQGDAIDSNGNIVMSGGTVIVHGPTSAPEESVDFNGTFVISGGFLIAAGTNSNMNKAMSSTSTQNGIYATTSSGVGANSIFHIQDASGNDLATFKPIRSAYSFLFSSPKLVNGSYSIYTGGTSTGTSSDGLCTGGTYSGGTAKKTFTISNRVTSLTF
jgi:trimeric autotransporter adhesin